MCGERMFESVMGERYEKENDLETRNSMLYQIKFELHLMTLKKFHSHE